MSTITPPQPQLQFLSREEVLAEAKAWAQGQSQPSVQVQAVAQSWLDEGMTAWTSESIREALEGFFRVANQSTIQYELAAAHEKSSQANWAIECVKHIALINLAGIAGVVTLLAGQTPPKPGIQLALIFFILGSLSAVLSFLAGAGTFGESAAANRRRADLARNAKKWDGLTKKMPAPTFDKFSRWAGLLIVLSGISTLCGVGRLIIAYW
jgi:hypothetical protein